MGTKKKGPKNQPVSALSHGPKPKGPPPSSDKAAPAMKSMNAKNATAPVNKSIDAVGSITDAGIGNAIKYGSPGSGAQQVIAKLGSGATYVTYIPDMTADPAILAYNESAEGKAKWAEKERDAQAERSSAEGDYQASGGVAGTSKPHNPGPQLPSSGGGKLPVSAAVAGLLKAQTNPKGSITKEEFMASQTPKPATPATPQTPVNSSSVTIGPSSPGGSFVPPGSAPTPGQPGYADVVHQGVMGGSTLPHPPGKYTKKKWGPKLGGPSGPPTRSAL